MPVPIPRRTRIFALVAMLFGEVTACDPGSADPPRSTVAVTSTTYVTVPARTTTTTAPRSTAADSGDDPAGQDDEPEETAADDPTQERIHEIESGDYLVGIARDYDVPINYIPEYNGWTDGLGHALVPGETIRIPPSDWTPEGERDSTTGTDEAEPGSTSDEGCGTYTIRAGDTKGRVAAAHDVTVAELDAANAGTEFYAGFVIGIDIVIPC